MKELLKDLVTLILKFITIIWFGWMMAWCFDIPFTGKTALGFLLATEFYQIFIRNRLEIGEKDES